MEFPNSFSEREKEVVDLLLQGKSNKQIAFSLGITNRTVEYHLGNIFAKLGVSSRSEAILTITNYKNQPTNNLGVEDIRESTVVNAPETVNNAKKPLRRIPMKTKKFIFAGLGLLTGILVIYLASPNLWKRSASMAEEIRLPDAAISSTPSPLPSQEQSALVEDGNSFTQTVGSVDVRLLINWFYIDESRANLEVAICGLPIPDGFRPVYLIDPAKLALAHADGDPIPLVQRDNSGSGGGEEQAPDE
mgnify:FL=1